MKALYIWILHTQSFTLAKGFINDVLYDPQYGLCQEFMKVASVKDNLRKLLFFFFLLESVSATQNHFLTSLFPGKKILWSTGNDVFWSLSLAVFEINNWVVNLSNNSQQRHPAHTLTDR